MYISIFLAYTLAPGIEQTLATNPSCLGKPSSLGQLFQQVNFSLFHYSRNVELDLKVIIFFLKIRKKKEGEGRTVGGYILYTNMRNLIKKSSKYCVTCSYILDYTLFLTGLNVIIFIVQA